MRGQVPAAPRRTPQRGRKVRRPQNGACAGFPARAPNVPARPGDKMPSARHAPHCCGCRTDSSHAGGAYQPPDRGPSPAVTAAQPPCPLHGVRRVHCACGFPRKHNRRVTPIVFGRHRARQPADPLTAAAAPRTRISFAPRFLARAPRPAGPVATRPGTLGPRASVCRGQLGAAVPGHWIPCGAAPYFADSAPRDPCLRRTACSRP